MNRSNIRTRLNHSIVMSVFANDSAEWASGKYSISAVDKPWPDAGSLLTLPAPVKFSTHYKKIAIPRHQHPHYEMMYVYSGEMTHTFDFGTVSMKEGDLLIISPGEAHSIAPCGSDDIAVNIICDRHFMENELSLLINTCAPINELIGDTAESRHLLLSSRNDPNSRTIADMLIGEFLDPDISSMNLIKCHLASLINALYRVYGANDGHVYQKTKGEKGDISYIYSYIQNHYATVTLAELAKVFGYDNYYLSKVIRKQLGATFIELKHYFCLEEAKRLLKTSDMTVREVSEHVGFNNMSYFYKIFAENCSMTPAEYRIKEELHNG